MKKSVLIPKLIIFSLFLSFSVDGQNVNRIDSLKAHYNERIEEYKNNRDDEINKLPIKNYKENKKTIISKYQVLIDEVLSEKESKLEELREKNKERERQEKELLKIKNEKDRLEEERERRKASLEKQTLIKKKRQELERIKKRKEERELFLNSDRGRLYQQIKTEFNAWLMKSDMETSGEYKSRILNNSEIEFQNIVNRRIKFSKERLNKIVSACLSKYYIERERFSIDINQYEYGSPTDTSSYYIPIPKEIAPYMKEKFGCYKKAKNGRPILMHIVDFTLYKNHWIGSKVIFLFPNEGNRKPMYFTKPYYNDDYWNETKVYSKKNKYILEYASNILIEPIHFKNILSQLRGQSLNSGYYYYEWNLDEKHISDVSISMQDLNIIIPEF